MFQVDRQQRHSCAKLDLSDTTPFHPNSKENLNFMVTLPKCILFLSDLERTLESGTSIGAMGLKEDSGGVWMNDLKSLREDIA